MLSAQVNRLRNRTLTMEEGRFCASTGDYRSEVSRPFESRKVGELTRQYVSDSRHRLSLCLYACCLKQRSILHAYLVICSFGCCFLIFASETGLPKVMPCFADAISAGTLLVSIYLITSRRYESRFIPFERYRSARLDIGRQDLSHSIRPGMTLPHSCISRLNEPFSH